MRRDISTSSRPSSTCWLPSARKNTVSSTRSPRTKPTEAGPARRRASLPRRRPHPAASAAALILSRLAVAALLLVLSAPPNRAGDAPAGLATERTDLSPADLEKVRAVAAPATDFTKPEPFELLPGGAATSKKRPNQDAFSQSSANITFEQEADFKLGNGLFRKLWVSAPSSTQASDGLGPLFNARACQSCHLKDGRGHPPEGNADATSMFFRLARAPVTDEEKAAVADRKLLNLPDPIY